MTIFHGSNNPAPVPERIAVCPQCGGNLEALFNVLDSLVPGVNLYQISMPTLYCRQNEEHGCMDTHVDEWFETYDLVAEWLARECLLELEPGEIQCNESTD